MKELKTVLIAGSSGLVGGHLLKVLVESKLFDKIYTIGRRAPRTAPTETEFIKFDFKNQDAYNNLPKVDYVFCCLGTTIKKAGSQEAFRQVDYTYPFLLGEWAASVGVSQYHIVTALGAKADSPIFYNQVKGEIERDLANLFNKGLSIYQPSIILGAREETRVGEYIGKIAMSLARPLMIGGLKKYRPIQAENIAKGMLEGCLNGRDGNKIYESDEIESLANSRS